MTGDKSVVERWNLKSQRSHIGRGSERIPSMVLSCLGSYSPGLVLQNLGVRKVRMWPGGLSSPLRQVTSQSLRFLTCKGAGASVILELGHVHT